MNELALESHEADPEVLRGLVSRYISSHSNFENYITWFFAAGWLQRRLGIDSRHWPGRLAGGLVWSLMLLLPALILTALTGQWADAPLLSWIIVALTWGVNALLAGPLYGFAIGNELSWLGTIVDEADLRRLLAWHGRWYSHRVITPVGGALTLALVLPLLVVVRGSAVAVPAGTLYISIVLIFLVMQNACAIVMVPFETYNLSTCRYALYRLSPADSVLMRRSLRGYNQLGLVNVLYVTLNIFLVLVLLPRDSPLLAPFVASLFVLEFVYTALGTVVPRLILGNIIRSRKEGQMAVLQRRLDDLVPRIEELSDDEYRQMKRLRETQDAIRDSPENLLPLAEILRAAAALLLSALTILATAFAQEWLAGLLQRLAR